MASLSTDPNGNRTIQFVTIVHGKRTRRSIRLGKMSKRAAEAIQTKIEAIHTANRIGVSLDGETAEWLANRDDRFYAKLVQVGLVPERAKQPPSEASDSGSALLGPFLESYINGRSDVKDDTAIVYGHTQRNLREFFGVDRPLAEITPGDADDWRRHLARPKDHVSQAGQGLAENTVRRRCAIAKQFFRAAVRKKLIAENPFQDMAKLSVRSNRSREFFLTRDAAAKVLETCPDAQWRLLFALSRYGGLRCPSEHLLLRWCDVDWAAGRFRVTSPKTAHHEGKESRLVPIFPELRPYLEEVWDAAAPGTEWVITRYRDASLNLRTRFSKIIRRAGLEPWPKLWVNLRGTRQTELSEIYPAHVVCEWLGNSVAVARAHYLQVTDEHFRRATGALHIPVQSAAFDGPDAVTTSEGTSRIVPQNAGNSEQNLAVVAIGVGDEGLEPPTSTV